MAKPACTLTAYVHACSGSFGVAGQMRCVRDQQLTSSDWRERTVNTNYKRASAAYRVHSITAAASQPAARQQQRVNDLRLDRMKKIYGNEETG